MGSVGSGQEQTVLEPQPLREYGQGSGPGWQAGGPPPYYAPVPPPVQPPYYAPGQPSVVPGTFPPPPVPARAGKRAGKVWLVLAFVLVSVLSMCTGSVGTFLFLRLGSAPQLVTHSTPAGVNVKAMIVQLDQGSGDPQKIYDSITSKTPAMSDALDDASKSYWSETAPLSASHPTNCHFENDSYHVIGAHAKYFNFCTTEQAYTDFAFQVEFSNIQGYEGGLVFRGSVSQHTYYVWRMDTNGAYRLSVYKGPGDATTILEGGHIPYFQPGYRQKNTLMVIASGQDILLYVNGHYLGRAKDSSYAFGEIGLLVYNGDDTTEISFTNARLWNL